MLTIRGPGDFRRDIQFHIGLNLVYGKRSASGSTRGTCNSIGKSCVLWAIDFCLGGTLDMEVPPSKLALPGHYLGGWEFTLDFDLGDTRIKATRTVNASDMIFVEGDASSLPIQPTVTPNHGAADTLTPLPFYDEKSWERLLGIVFFSLPAPCATIGMPDVAPPTYRQLFGYFCRRGFTTPLAPNGFNPPRATQGKVLAYLFGLDWWSVGKYNDLTKGCEDKRKINEACVVRAAELNTDIPGLRRECRRMRVELETKQSALQSFAVDPEYREREAAANALTQEISTLRRRLVSNRLALKVAEEDGGSESVPVDAVRRMYEAAGVELGQRLWNTLEATEDFHRKIDTHRRDVVEEQKRRLRVQIESDETAAREKDEKRAELLRHLSSHGALEEYTRLQAEIVELGNDLAVKENCCDDFDASKSVLDVAKESKKAVEEEARASFENSTAAIYEANRAFVRVANSLYDHGSGSLDISIDVKSGVLGYDIKVKLEGTGGAGVNKMKSFAFDLAILLRQIEQCRKIDFILHDGQIFSDAELRQRVEALKFVNDYARGHGVQYITGLNYDAYPESELAESFSLDDVAVLKLGDGSPAEKLFGFNF